MKMLEKYRRGKPVLTPLSEMSLKRGEGGRKLLNGFMLRVGNLCCSILIAHELNSSGSQGLR